MGVKSASREKILTKRLTPTHAFFLRRHANAIIERAGDGARRTLFRCVFVALATSLFAIAARAEDARIEGSYVNRAPSEAPIKVAIEWAIAPLNFIARPIARHRLKNSNPVPLKVAFERADSTLIIRLGNTKPIGLVPGGARVQWERAGEMLEVGARWEGATLVQSFVSKDGERLDRYFLSSDGNTLSLAVVLTSPLLPRAVEYRIDFAREPLR